MPAGLGRWTVPIGAVRHGEHPADAVVRCVSEEAGQAVRVVRPIEVVTEIDETPEERIHRDRIIFEVAPAVAEQGNWFRAEELARLSLTSLAQRVLGVGGHVADSHHRIESVTWAEVPGESPTRRQRFAAYGFATDPAGRILLTLIAQGYPGAGRWHLPGGGTDFGETAELGLLREIAEETGQHGEIGPLVSVSHRHQPSVVGPEQVPMDWHGIRVVYRVRVPEPTPPEVLDGGGSTEAAAWFTPDRVTELQLTEVADAMVGGAVRVENA
jgi:ADP-ribose pyrophosphatase YjhB (NUDIX family)